MNRQSPTPTRAEIEAGEWLTALSQRLVSIDQRTEFETWLKSSPEHARVYEAAKEVSHVASTCTDLLDEARAEEAAALESRGKRLMQTAVAASAVFALGAVLFTARE